LKIRLHKPQRAGFSLVELLLTLVLILCLAAASVFTFTAIYRSSNLDEGVDRFQSLIRFAQAEASTTGRKVRLEFVPARAVDVKMNPEVELRDIKVMWEADLLNAPGVFAEYTNKAWSEEIVNELVGVQKVKTDQSIETIAAPENTAAAGAETSEIAAFDEEFPSITFYPDGSCDSAEIVLASRNPEDERRLEVHLSGLLGSVSTRAVDSASDEFSEETESSEMPQADEGVYEEVFDSSEPLQSNKQSDFAR
jgi:prepilin-type N-terminal cleavage/methylation domain-containing protein